MSENKLIFNSKEMAEILGISIPTLRQIMRSSNPPPYIQLGRKFVFPIKEVTEWLSKSAMEREAL